MKQGYYGTEGIIKGHLGGVFIVKASGIYECKQELEKVIGKDSFYDESRIQAVWSGVESCIDLIETHCSDHYTKLSNKVFYFEI